MMIIGSGLFFFKREKSTIHIKTLTDLRLNKIQDHAGLSYKKVPAQYSECGLSSKPIILKGAIKKFVNFILGG
jgi:hypothetical protein